jgi:hypothetical protein
MNLDTLTGKDAGIGCVYDKEGLMNGWPLKATNFTTQVPASDDTR